MNGDDLPNSREQVLGIGPGVMWNHSPNNTLTLNFYTETAVENRLRNSAIVNLFYIHGF
ncbi:transporter [Escherichia coli]|uniref:transporter n=1 Tax=Escherichia coli TaxID=562 RepID=UPI001FCEF81D|nr:transporter [Escherichia coli]